MNIPPEAFHRDVRHRRAPRGWMAQWLELMNDPELKIARPRQIYTGPRDVDYVPMNERNGQR